MMKQAKLMTLSIDSILLDEENPRIKQCLENYKTITPEAIALALFDGGDGDAATSYRVLRDSIKDSGGIIHPIIVNLQEDGVYVCIEGNTRLQIYKDFVERNVPGNWGTIPALVYEGLTLVEKHGIRLQSHLVGPRDWDPYSKAKYLYQLSEIECLPMNTIVNMCGGNSTEITKSIDAYKHMKIYYEPYAKSQGLVPDNRDYSKFREYENSRIKSAIKNRGYEDNQFAKWVADGNVDKAQSVRLIPMVLRSPEALDAFLKGNLSDAEKVLHAAELENADLSEYPYDVLSNELYKKLINFSVTEVEELANNPDKASHRNALERLKSKLDFVIELIEKREK